MWRPCWSIGFAIVALLYALAGSASARVERCPPGNVLAGRRPVASPGVRGNTALVTDGRVAEEGAPWNGPLAVVLEGLAASLTYDLGEAMAVRAIVVQADANDVYSVWGSLDGERFSILGWVEAAPARGLRTRTLLLGGRPIRFLRFGEAVGDGAYSVSELAAFCDMGALPPALEVVREGSAPAPAAGAVHWTDQAAMQLAFVLAVLGVVLLSWGARLDREEGSASRRRWRDRALAAAALAAVPVYFNFGAFHFPGFVHYWDTFHYYVGAKYFRELSYQGLYDCVAVAEAADPARRRSVELRKMTDLRTNELRTTENALADPERCRRRFAPERWAEFTRDVDFFRAHLPPALWDMAMTDHGFNATPVWTIAGAAIATRVPATERSVLLLALLDEAYFAGMLAVVWWAFGWRVLAVGLLVFATNFPSRFGWTGGAFLRWDWLFFLVASVCCLRKGRNLLGGLALGYSTLLRVFPGVALLGPLLAFGFAARAHGLVSEATRPYRRFALGVLLAGAVLVPASLWTAGGLAEGTRVYAAFLNNSIKHVQTPLANYMGLRTVLAYRPSEVARRLRDERFFAPWKRWSESRREALRQARPVYIAVVLGFLILLALAVRHVEPWMSLSLGSMLIAVGPELTCYYYSFILVVALLHARRDAVGPLLLGVTALSQAVALPPILGWLIWPDELYTFVSAVTLAAFAVILWWFGAGLREPAIRRTGHPASDTG
jgi:hypothetical protein